MVTKRVFEVSGDQLDRLTQIAVEHSRLAAEYGRKDTSVERREEIIIRIKELRAERASLLQN
ncbi:hypothetical protein DNHGIG_14740 [Collibacillus ludicampi]|uniref:Uncharacterized protein n=1 Tax=Collibacillus ludicampi TaxID=2771369 RepID=A0AAV4LDM2_9BACL|nr:hypothetical protein [Collibacillus ludicampi]GIM45925.1 hypothetical protein DNHGIG_14740 [Collibacillus ludicampi]